MALPAAAVYTVLYNGPGIGGGGGFNTANANMLTDLTATSATGNAPVVGSATYTFVAGDVNHWVFVKSGTNWTAGFYKIASVAGGQATLNATIGQATQYNATTNMWVVNTVAGCATVASPSGGTFGVDYSTSTAALTAVTDLASTASTTITSASAPFTPVMAGNIVRISSAGTGATLGWYELVSYTNTATAVLDAVSGTYTGATLIIGGSLVMLDANLEIGVAGNVFFVLSGGTHTVGAAISIAAAGGTQNPIRIVGCNAIRGDEPTGANRPTIAFGANSIVLGANWDTYNLIWTGTASVINTPAANCKAFNCKGVNTSTTVDRYTWASNSTDNYAFNCEGISYRGFGWGTTNNSNWQGVGIYTHASNIGLPLGNTTGNIQLSFCISADNITAAVNVATALAQGCSLNNCTLFGAVNKRGSGIKLATGTTDFRYTNCILYGFATGASHVDVQSIVFSDYNDYFNNTADTSNMYKGPHDKALDPQFSNVTQVAGTAGAFVAGNNKLVDTTKNFTALGVAALDYVGILSGTGATAGVAQISSISTTTNPNDTLNVDVAVGTNTTADKVYSISLGNNFAIGNSNLKSTGFPGAFPASTTTGYNSMGGVQVPTSNNPVGQQST